MKASLVCLALAVVLAAATHASAEVIWTNPSTAGFSTLPLNTPTPFAFPGTGGMTMTRTSAVGSGVTPGTVTLTIAETIGGFTNPPWVVGTRTYFNIGYFSLQSDPYAGSTVSYESQFAGGLATTSQLVFVDFDAAESVTVKAYDLANNLIPFASTSVLLSAGQDSSPQFGNIEWASLADATGRLRNTVTAGDGNVVASINSTTSIARLVYEFDMNPNNNSDNSIIRFSFAAVPEPSTCLMALACLACGGYSMFRRRKRA